MYGESIELKEMAQKIISKKEILYHIAEYDYHIGYFYCDEAKRSQGKRILGQCIKVSGILSHYTDYDFIIVIYEPNISNFNDAQLQALLYHELLHIGEDYRIVKHDVNDFYSVLKEFGVDWQWDTNLKTIVGGE